jgi:hypothetical protein
MHALGSAQLYLLLLLVGLQRAAVHPNPAGRTHQLIVAGIAFLAMIGLPVIAFYYARRWRP